jgi:nicotinate-nucleotide pyrophosphorylase (carboxylating)
MRLRGRARALLTAERSALNTVQHLSGIATLTRPMSMRSRARRDPARHAQDDSGPARARKIRDADGRRDQSPDGLWDAAMIKDNHVAVAGGIGEAVRRAVAAGIERIIVEVDRVDQIEPALARGATHLLLDNMDPATLRGAVTLVGGRVPTEASGGVRLDTIRAIAQTGVTYISVGRLTQSAPAADIGLDFSAAG